MGFAPEQQQIKEHMEVPKKILHDHTYQLIQDNVGLIVSILGFALIGIIVTFRKKIKEWLK